MKTAGWSTYLVAGQVDRSECAVRNWWEQWTREVTRSTIRADVGVAIVPQTISRQLAEANLKSKHPFRALHLTPEHRQLRLQWCQARSMWNVTDCQKVVFSDESRFVLGTDDNRVWVWRCPDGDRFNSSQVIYSQFGLAIHQNDYQARRRFVEWAQNEIAVVPDFHKRILFSDEAHFWLNGYVNKQNCRIWSEANPQMYVETPLHPEKLTVWCALWAGGILLQKR
ncbi:HTH_Tnp_Tc3_2 domain-containing protein [Trichonephila clavipes]|nr:HTH_Tnp_Tc3_2 domain-containing protein [Trichonephila clavipes]